MLYFWNPDDSLIPNMMLDTSPSSSCSRRSPRSPCSGHRISSKRHVWREIFMWICEIQPSLNQSFFLLSFTSSPFFQADQRFNPSKISPFSSPIFVSSADQIFSLFKLCLSPWTEYFPSLLWLVPLLLWDQIFSNLTFHVFKTPTIFLGQYHPLFLIICWSAGQHKQSQLSTNVRIVYFFVKEAAIRQQMKNKTRKESLRGPQSWKRWQSWNVRC